MGAIRRILLIAFLVLLVLVVAGLVLWLPNLLTFLANPSIIAKHR